MRIYCFKDFFWNLTKPYFMYESGKWYNVKLSRGVYVFKESDLMFGDKINLNRYFLTESEYRNYQIDKIINNHS